MFFQFKLGLVIVLIFSSVATGSEPKTIRIAIGEWKPFYSKSYQHYGVIPQIMSKAFEIEGVKVEYGFFPWARSYKFAKDGLWDATGCWTARTKEREQDFYFSDPVMKDPVVFFHLKEFDFDWKTLADLKNIKIGGTLSYMYSEEFKQAKNDGLINVSEASSDEISFKKLLQGRIQILPQDKVSGYFIIQQLFNDEDAAKFTHHPLVLDTLPMCLFFSKKVEKSMEMRDHFNRGFRTLKDSGEYDRLLESLYAKDFSPKSSGE